MSSWALMGYNLILYFSFLYWYQSFELPINGQSAFKRSCKFKFVDVLRAIVEFWFNESLNQQQWVVLRVRHPSKVGFKEVFANFIATQIIRCVICAILIILKILNFLPLINEIKPGTNRLWFRSSCSPFLLHYFIVLNFIEFVAVVGKVVVTH